MELLLELLLTMVLSMLIAFVLGKIVSIGAPEGDDPGARGDAEGVRAPFLAGTGSPSEAAAPGSRAGLRGEVEGEAAAIGGIGGGVHGDGVEVASGVGGGCDGTGEDWGFGEVGRRREEEEGVAVGSEEATVKELGVEEVAGGQEIPGATVEKTEENLADEPTEEIGRVIRRLAMEENLLVPKDAGQVVNVALSVNEEEEVAKELDAGEVGTESLKKEERLPVVETDDQNVVPCGMAMEFGLKREGGGPETSVEDEKVGSLYNEDDDWEGIEKSDLEKLFTAATAFVSSNKGSEALARLSSDLQMQLYGLHKIATEGPCYESQPMSLKVSARAKWHAWQRLGSMNPEMAMEQYTTLVSDNIPGWMPQKNRAVDNLIEGEGDSPDKGLSGSGAAFSSSSPEVQFFKKNERNLESYSYTGECNVPVVSEGTNQGDHATDSALV